MSRPDRPTPARGARIIDSRRLLVALVRGEELGLVVPLALEIVSASPLASAGCFRGDLLRGLMEVPGSFWGACPQLYERYRAALRAAATLRRQLPREERMEFWSRLDAEVAEHGERMRT
ncbi:MAG TPA: hypothetical protein VF761_05965 [Gemmatimonadaceae bacterium]